MLKPLRGEWRRCTINGVLREHGGYKILEWRAEGPAVDALLFVSEDLPAYWPVLDEFEGEAYERIAVPIEGEGDAYVYVDRKRLTGSEIRS